MVTWVLFLGIGLVIGVIAGLYFARLDDVSNKQKNALQQKLYQTEQKLESYQSQVTDHFLKTASLVNSMTESYKAVHEHLAMGARELCDNQVNVAQLEMPATKLLDRTKEQEVEQQASLMPNQETGEQPEESAEIEKIASTTEETAEQPKEQEPLQPPSTPESLHVDDGESKSLKDADQTAVNVSRMVH